MNEKSKNKSNKTAKIILFIAAIILVVFLFRIGSCIYTMAKNIPDFEVLKTMQATDEEINMYRTFLDMNMELKQLETKKYEEIIPLELKKMKFENHAEASEKYYELYSSKEWTTLSKEEQMLGEAFFAYADYYAATSTKMEFLKVMKVPKVSKILAKAMMENDAKYQEFKGGNGEKIENE